MRKGFLIGKDRQVLLYVKERANLRSTVPVGFKILSVKTNITALWNPKGLAEM